MIGKVVSTKMTKTAVVLVDSTRQHPMYKKSFKVSKKYLADDQIGVKDGDVVSIVKIRPISRRKHWRIEKVLGQDFVMIAEAKLKEVSDDAIAEVMPEDLKDSEELGSTQKNSEKSETLEKSEKLGKTQKNSEKSQPKADRPVDEEKSEEKPKRVRKTEKEEVITKKQITKNK